MNRAAPVVRGVLVIGFLLGGSVAGGPPAARQISVTALLDRYAGGQFEAVLGELTGSVDYDEILTQLRRDGAAWIATGGPETRAARELAAATFALEAARAGAWREWKFVQKQPQMCAENGECIQPPNVLYWKAPPLLIEWGCALLRGRPVPHPAERLWQLAALAVAQRSEDPQFLVGDTSIGRGWNAGETGNTKAEIKHLDHAASRFPKEVRFVLAQGIARDRAWPEDALSVYRALEKDPDTGGEALMRLGAMQMRHGRTGDAVRSFDRAETLTRDRYVVFLSRFFRAQVLEREGRNDDAEAAYRGAIAAVPHAQSATVALAALVFRDGRRSEAQHLIGGMLAADPPALDPWRAFVHADDRFWPLLIGRLRGEILP